MICAYFKCSEYAYSVNNSIVKIPLIISLRPFLRGLCCQGSVITKVVWSNTKNLHIQAHPQRQSRNITEKYHGNELSDSEWPFFSFLMEFQLTLLWINTKVCHLDLMAISLIFQWLKYDKWNLPAAIPVNWPASDSSECCTFPIGNPLSLAFRQCMLSKNDREADRIIRKSQKDPGLLECHFQQMNLFLLFALEFTRLPKKSGAHVLGILVFFSNY